MFSSLSRMPLYAYRAIDDDSKEVTGTTEALSLDEAKKALSDMHLEPIEVNEAMRIRRDSPKNSPADDSAKTLYAFEGKDREGQVHRGTIQAESRRGGFDRLMRDRNLLLTFLTPVGVEPARDDEELRTWQREDIRSSAPSAVDGWQTIPDERSTTQIDSVSVSEKEPVMSRYSSLFSTMRLYAGWLLVWYGLCIAVGYYQTVRDLPFTLPLVSGFVISPLVFGCVLAMFLYLLLHSLQQFFRGEVILGSALTLVGVTLFLFLRLQATIV